MKFLGMAFGNKKTSTFSSSAVADAPPIKINGAQYNAIDTLDGYFTLKDVFFFGEVPKGEKNAPEDVKGPRMQQMVNSATEKYEKEKFAAPAHLGHHKAIAFQDPEFLGFMMPKRVGKTVLDNKEQDAVYGDLKLKASAFERVKTGQLPFLSPEVDWESWQFSSMALLDSMPPHFKGPLVTIGKVTKDPGAKFTVKNSISMGKFSAVEADVKEEEKEDSENDGHDDAKMCAHCAKKMAAMEASYGQIDKTMADIHFRMGLPYKGAQMEANRATVKPDSSAPAEDEKAKESSMKFADDPETRAKFDAQEARTKALEDKLSARDAEEAKAKRIEGAFCEMKGYPLTDAAKASIAYFAAFGDEPLKKYVESLKAQTQKEAPKSVAEFEAGAKEAATQVSGADPDLAEFQLKRPNDMPAILKYAQYHASWAKSKASFGASDEIKKDRKKFIELMMKIDPTGDYIDNHKIEGSR